MAPVRNDSFHLMIILCKMTKNIGGDLKENVLKTKKSEDSDLAEMILLRYNLNDKLGRTVKMYKINKEEELFSAKNSAVNT